MSFAVDRERLICPFDSTPTNVVGSGDFAFCCPQCGRQYRADQTVATRIGIACAAVHHSAEQPGLAGIQRRLRKTNGCEKTGLAGSCKGFEAAKRGNPADRRGAAIRSFHAIDPRHPKSRCGRRSREMKVCAARPCGSKREAMFHDHNRRGPLDRRSHSDDSRGPFPRTYTGTPDQWK